MFFFQLFEEIFQHYIATMISVRGNISSPPLSSRVLDPLVNDAMEVDPAYRHANATLYTMGFDDIHLNRHFFHLINAGMRLEAATGYMDTRRGSWHGKKKKESGTNRGFLRGIYVSRNLLEELIYYMVSQERKVSMIAGVRSNF